MSGIHGATDLLGGESVGPPTTFYTAQEQYTRCGAVFPGTFLPIDQLISLIDFFSFLIYTIPNQFVNEIGKRNA